MTITYKVESLYADISTICVQARRAAVTANDRDTHDVEDVLDDGNRELIMNTMSRLMYEAMNILYPFCKTPIEKTCLEDEEGEPEAYVVVLDFPYERSATEVEEVKACIHGYVTYKCAAEWLALTLPDTKQWEICEQRAQDIREQLTTALVLPMRPRIVRIKPRYY